MGRPWSARYSLLAAGCCWWPHPARWLGAARSSTTTEYVQVVAKALCTGCAAQSKVTRYMAAVAKFGLHSFPDHAARRSFVWLPQHWRGGRGEGHVHQMRRCPAAPVCNTAGATGPDDVKPES